MQIASGGELNRNRPRPGYSFPPELAAMSIVGTTAMYPNGTDFSLPNGEEEAIAIMNRHNYFYNPFHVVSGCQDRYWEVRFCL